MIYLLYGTKEYLIKKELKKIVSEAKIEAININNYQLENSLLSDIIEDALTVSLFDDKKIIIVENSYIFSATTSKKYPKQDITILEDYFDHPNDHTILIFILNREKIDGRKKIVSYLKKIGTIKEFNELSDINQYIQDMFGEYKINLKDIQLLRDRVGDQLLLMEQEIQKIKIYKDDDLHIQTDDILKLVHKNVNVDIFELIENIIHKNIEPAIESYHEMIKLGEEPIKIIIMLASQIRIMYQSKELSKKGYREKDIANILGIHPYRVKLALQKGYSYSSKVLLQSLLQLAKIDENIKKGKIDKTLALELFILNN